MAEAAAARITRWRTDPVAFVRECFHAEPDAWQVDVLRALVNNNRIAMKAAKGCGKSTILAWVSWWFLVTRAHPKIAATSITADNLADGLWPEMAKWRNESAFLKSEFEWTKTRIFLRSHPETWWMSARTWAKGADSTQQADALAGLHANHLLFVLDEVGGIPDAVMAAVEAGLSTGGDTKIIMAGNPTHLTGPLYRACTTDRELWYLAEITGDPDNPKRAPRISIQWAKDQIKKWGPDNPWVLTNVFGKFPPSSLNTLLGPDDVAGAVGKHIILTDYQFAQKRLGVDVARFGDDRTVIFPRQGLVAFRPSEMRGARSNDIAARVIAAKFKWGSELEFVDGTGGWGSGVVDSMIQANCSPMEVQFAGKAIDNRYANKRAEMWFLMAEWIKRGGAIPNDPELVKELTAPSYTIQNGKFLLEPKEQIKARLGFSPDKADALALTFALPEQPSNISTLATLASNRVVADYDPFDSSRY